MRRILIIVIVVAILAIAINDLSRWASAQRNLTQVTEEMATRADGERTNGMTREQVGADIATLASQRGVTVYQYDQTAQGVAVWTQTQVVGTIVVGPVIALINNTPYKQAMKTPFIIRAYKTAGI